MTNYFAALVDELYAVGVREVVISPGSRSTPLALLFCEHSFQVYVHIDERSAAFFALGIAKEQGRPVVLLCTSGSALGNYFPGIIEARYAYVPLIVLTADRPPEMQMVGAPQTIDQNKFYQDYVKHFEALALPEETPAMYRYVRVVIQKAYAAAMQKNYGVAHINIPIREPLVPDLEQLDFSQGRQALPFRLTQGEAKLSFESKLLENKKGMIICGCDAYAQDPSALLQLSERLQAPILADPLSNLRNFCNDRIIDSYDAFLKRDAVKEALAPDYILHFGQLPVSKRLQQFVALHQDALYIQVGEAFAYCNPLLSTQQYVLASPKAFADAVATVNEDSAYLKKWQAYQNSMRAQLNEALHAEEFFEGPLVQILQRSLPENSRLIVANSMPIRELDYFFEASAQKLKVLCNRGANGIDGVVSTALGVATAGHPTVLLAGDLSLFHDMNGLLVGKTHGLQLMIILINNNGGGIFRYLPQHTVKNFEYLFLTPHGLSFEGLKTLYGIQYCQVNTALAFERQLKETLDTPGIKLLEVSVDSARSKALHDIYTNLR